MIGMKRKLKVGIIGCGSIAGAHAGGWKSCDAEITAVYDIDQARARSFAEQFGGEVKSDLAALLDCDLDAVSITTPPSAHADCAVEALRRNIHVLLEKPFALDLAGAERIMRALENSDAKLMTAFRHRFLPANQQIKSMIDSGALGRIIFFFNRFYSNNPSFASDWHSDPAIAGGGAVMDVAAHSIDLFRYFFGDVADKKIHCARHFGGAVEDTAMIQLQSVSGVIGEIAVGWAAGVGSDTVEIVGSCGTVVYDYKNIDELKILRPGCGGAEIIRFPRTWGFPEQIQAFRDAIVNDTAAAVSAEDGLINLQDIFELYNKRY